MKVFLILLFPIFTFNLPPSSDELSKEALETILYTTSGDSTNLKMVLNEYQEKAILIDLWASWCKDCIAGFPKVKELQKNYPDIKFLFLSVDLKDEEWQRGIERFGLTGDHYRINAGWKSALCSSIELDWIPRYLIVDNTGKIIHYKSIVADNENLIQALKAINN